MLTRQSVVVPKNRLLNAFDSESRARVDPHLERINFMLGDVICEAGGVSITPISRMALSFHC
jgi:hypothetical protein